jgi:hypothetical protein
MTTRAPFTGCLLVALAVFSAAGRGQISPAAGRTHPAVGLTDFISAATRDTNADGFPDAVVARIIVPAAGSREDVAAASNITARLGFETMALTLPIVARDSDVVRPADIALPSSSGGRTRSFGNSSMAGRWTSRRFVRGRASSRWCRHRWAGRTASRS